MTRESRAQSSSCKRTALWVVSARSIWEGASVNENAGVDRTRCRGHGRHLGLDLAWVTASADEVRGEVKVSAA